MEGQHWLRRRFLWFLDDLSAFWWKHIQGALRVRMITSDLASTVAIVVDKERRDSSQRPTQTHLRCTEGTPMMCEETFDETVSSPDFVKPEEYSFYWFFSWFSDYPRPGMSQAAVKLLPRVQLHSDLQKAIRTQPKVTLLLREVKDTT